MVAQREMHEHVCVSCRAAIKHRSGVTCSLEPLYPGRKIKWTCGNCLVPNTGRADYDYSIA